MWLLFRLRRQMVSDFKQDVRPNHWHTRVVVEKVDYGYCGSIFHNSGDVYGMTETRPMKSVASATRGRTSPTAPTHGVAHGMTQTSLHNRHKHGPQQKACLWSLDRLFLRITRVTHKLGSYMCSEYSENVIYTRQSQNISTQWPFFYILIFFHLGNLMKNSHDLSDLYRTLFVAFSSLLRWELEMNHFLCVITH